MKSGKKKRKTHEDGRGDRRAKIADLKTIEKNQEREKTRGKKNHETKTKAEANANEEIKAKATTYPRRHIHPKPM
jgi:hypothetical protein